MASATSKMGGSFTVFCLMVLSCCGFAQGFVQPQHVRFSYRYNICSSPSAACNPQPLLGAPLAAPSFLSGGRLLRGSQSNPLFAGSGDGDILEQVRDVVAEQLGVEKERVKSDSNFVKDLEADSLDSVELVMALEEKFGVSIPDEEATKITTVQQAVDYITKNKA